MYRALLHQTKDRRIALWMLIAFTKDVLPLPEALGKRLMEFLVIL